MYKITYKFTIEFIHMLKKEEDVLSSLEILGIYKLSQLEKGNIDYWWKVKLINEKGGENSRLIEINNAREFLNNNFSFDEIKNFLIDDNQKISLDSSKSKKRSNLFNSEVDSQPDKEFFFVKSLSQNKKFKYSFEINLFGKISFLFLVIVCFIANILLGLIFLLVSIWVVNGYAKSFILINNQGIDYKFFGIKQFKYNIKFSEINKCSFCPPHFMTIKFKNKNKKILNLILPDKKTLEIVDNINEHLYLFNKKD